MKHFARFFAVVLFVSMVLNLLPAGLIHVSADPYTGYVSLDSGKEAIAFDGATVTWNGQTWTLDDHNIFLDYRLSDEVVEAYPFVYNDVLEAFQALKNGTETQRMNLLIAPGVYWVDDPDDPAIRGTNGTSPNGPSINCDYMTFMGLNSVADNVVICANRGQQAGSQGNFTNINFTGSALITRNVTFGNYCNVDLEFPLDSVLPEGQKLSREKRSDVITQAQLFSYSNGGKFDWNTWTTIGGIDAVCYNTNFISRLNLCPVTGTYYNCHFESSGHSGAGSIFVGCTLEFYNVNFSGGKYFDCDILLCPFKSNWMGKDLYSFGFVDGDTSGMACIDCRFTRSQDLIDNNIPAVITWDKVPHSDVNISYTYNCTLDGKPIRIQQDFNDGVTVMLEDYPELLKGYRLEKDGKVYYNLLNACGKDALGYDEAIKEIALAEGKDENYYFNIPTIASLSASFSEGASASSFRSGKDSAELSFKASSKNDSPALGSWKVLLLDETQAPYVKLTENADGTVTVEGTNNTEDPVKVIFRAVNELGIEARTAITVLPSFTDAPVITGDIEISEPADGKVELVYDIDLGSDLRTEESVINWYRSKNNNTKIEDDDLPLSLSRENVVEKEYTLGEGDVGYYLKAVITPKHNRSELGAPVVVCSDFIVADDDVQIRYIDTDLHDMPETPQGEYLPGTWVRDGYHPAECTKQSAWNANPDSWGWGPGKEGAMGYTGLINKAQGARMYYNPVAHHTGNMVTELTLATAKNAGQGFGSANNQFTDILIKYNQDLTQNLTEDDLGKVVGYAIRFERLNADDVAALAVPEGSEPWDKAGAGSATACSLIRYTVQHTVDKSGNDVIAPVAEHLTYRVMTSCYNSLCTVRLEYKDGKLIGDASSTMDARSADQYGYPRSVHFEVDGIEDDGFSGTGYLCTGTTNWTLNTNCNYTLVNSWKTIWGNPEIEADADAADFGDVAKGEKVSMKITVNAKDLAGQLNIEAEGEGIAVELGENFDPKNGGEIIITIDTEKAGAVEGTVVISTPGADDIEISVSANVKSAADPNGDTSAIGTMAALMAACAVMIVLVSKKRVKA